MKRQDIKSLEYLNKNIIVECADGQSFYETPKHYEIWNEEPLFLVKRKNRKSIGWVTTK